MPNKSEVLQLRKQYRAPQGDGEILAIPEKGTAFQLAEQTSEQLRNCDTQLCSTTLSELRQKARREIIERAVVWTNRITGEQNACAECSHQAGLLFVTGHQPQLAHAGVWAKNLAAAGLAQQTQGVGLNIIVDNDTVGSQALAVPTGTAENPRVERVAYDSSHPQQPWEELTVSDPDSFCTFGDRVTEKLGKLANCPAAQNNVAGCCRQRNNKDDRQLNA